MRVQKRRLLPIISKAALEVLMWLSTLIILIPLAFVLINSLKTRLETTGQLRLNLPAVPQFSNYLTVLLKNNMMQSFLNSAIYAGGSVILGCLLSSMAAYIIVRRTNRLNKAAYYLLLIGMIAPGNIVTTFAMMKGLHLTNSYIGLILLYAGSSMPFSVFLYSGFFKSLPESLEEAAIIDGARAGTTFFRIVFPLMKPVTVTLAVLNFLSVWNDFINPLYLTSHSSKWGVTLMLFQFVGTFNLEYRHLLLSACMLIIIPTLIFYLLCQKYIISGMTSGALKN